MEEIVSEISRGEEHRVHWVFMHAHKANVFRKPVAVYGKDVVNNEELYKNVMTVSSPSCNIVFPIDLGLLLVEVHDVGGSEEDSEEHVHSQEESQRGEVPPQILLHVRLRVQNVTILLLFW